jgi:hypothetical protein
VETVPRFAARRVVTVAVVTALVLLVLSGRYGFHRDELYFLACGRHLAWGYADQPPLVPLIAHAMSLVSSSVVALRLPADLAVAATVVFTGLIARELGGAGRAQTFAAVAVAISNLTLGSGHLLSTTTLGVTFWAALLLLTLHVLRTGSSRWWVVAGVVAGVGLLDNDLVAFLVGAVVASLLLVGPRRVLLDPWLWLGIAIGLALWTPYLLWQARHGWPQLDIANAIAHGSSGSGGPRWAIPLEQLYLATPLLVPVWVAGLVRLLRRPEVRWARPLGVAWFVLLAAFVITGGKPYYLALTMPLLLGAGAEPAVAWWSTRSAAARRGWIIAIAVSAVVDAVATLPIVPVDALHATPVVAVNFDAGETVAWPAYVDQVASGWRRLGDPSAAIVASNYGEAGAVDYYGAHRGLPRAYAVQNSYWWWGRPPATTTQVLAIGFARDTLRGVFATVTPMGRLHNRYAVGNVEQDRPLWRCADPRVPWPVLWRRLRVYG